MKKSHIVFLILIVSFFQTKAKKIDGYYLTNRYDTIKVVFDIPIGIISKEPVFENIQWSIKYFDSKNKKQTLKPTMAAEIGFTFEGTKIKMLSRNNTLDLSGSAFNSDISKVFLHLLKDGKIKLFEFYGQKVRSSTLNTNSVVVYSSIQYILEKNNELFSPSDLFFKKDMKKCLSDCPDVYKKLEDNTYGFDDIKQIIFEYNYNCK